MKFLFFHGGKVNGDFPPHVNMTKIHLHPFPNLANTLTFKNTHIQSIKVKTLPKPTTLLTLPFNSFTVHFQKFTILFFGISLVTPFMLHFF